MYDLAVIGGGISGLGIAQLASVKYKKRVLLLERSDFANATSDNSLRIIHGGFRYLQTASIFRVVESLLAQDRLLSTYPNSIEPLACLMRLNKSGLKSKYPAYVASIFYNLLQNIFTSYGKPPVQICTSDALKFDALFKQGDLLLWWDAIMQDSAVLVDSIVDEVRAVGSDLINSVEIQSIEYKTSNFEINFSTPQGQRTERAAILVNASGPWLEVVRNQFNLDQQLGCSMPSYKWCRAFNLKLQPLALGGCAYGFEGKAGSLYFLCQRKDEAVIGTGYLPLDTEIDQVQISEMEAREFLDQADQALPELSLTYDQVMGVECGVLPVKKYVGLEPVLYGSEIINLYAGRYVEVLSTKYTSFQTQAQKLLKRLRLT